ncbi:MAG: serine/threonine-protein phosphatase [Lachnospiraceae bacterium]|nr:serine/threonine-protein phosphatase [Lachnospiraceae bacterium]
MATGVCKYYACAVTDAGQVAINQDSLLVKHAVSGDIECVMAIICDGMGGLDNGELASSEVIRAFDMWFNEKAEELFKGKSIREAETAWLDILTRENLKLRNYSAENGMEMGTTFTGIIILGEYLIIVHVGDSRIYHISNSISGSDICITSEKGSSAGIRQLTEDHTFVAREVKRGKMTSEEAKKDPRQSLLLQCVGASEEVRPQIIRGKAEPGTYLLCSDGFRHEMREREMADIFDPQFISDKEELGKRAQDAVATVKERGEKDNISLILIKCDKVSSENEGSKTEIMYNDHPNEKTCDLREGDLVRA